MTQLQGLLKVTIFNCSNILIASTLWKADTDLSAASHQAKGVTRKSKGGAGRSIIDAGSIKLAIVGSGCENAEKVEQVISPLLICMCLGISFITEVSPAIRL